MRKKILFVINTFSRAGAETALLDLLRKMDERNRESGNTKYDLSLFVLMGQGELAGKLPESVHLLNKNYCMESVLEPRGKRHMVCTVLKALLCRGTGIKLAPYMLRAYRQMRRSGQVRIDKILWRALSDGAVRLDETYDLAIAFLEGGSTYYVADHVKAKKKAAFIHIDYERAGYSRELDQNCYLKYDALFPIGEQVRRQFVKVYPECADRTKIFHNILEVDKIHARAQEPGGFMDSYDGIRILTVGRLTEQKAYPVAIEAMRLLKQQGVKARWYVLGEGPEREMLEQQIAKAGLQEDFLLLGATDNPYPYFAQTDIYVHATRYEGKSIAIQEAQILGCPIVASDINWEQIEQGKDGLLCSLDAKAVMEAILTLIEDPDMRKRFGQAALQKTVSFTEDIRLFDRLLEDESEMYGKRRLDEQKNV